MIGRFLRNLGDWLLRKRGPLLALLILGGGISTFIMPMLDRLERGERLNYELSRELDKKQAKAASLPELVEQRIQLKDEYTQLLRKLPTRFELDTLLHILINNAAESGIEFRQFTPDQVTSHEFYKEQAARIIYQGSYYQLGRMAQVLAEHPLITRWQKVLIEPDKSVNALIFEGELVSYAYRDENDKEEETSKSGRKKKR
ncbi:MAG: type 4a pilus biogenesis protein PilO, partial [Gammaproteobacteria bacterium]|nr:type 4a pilus biogenesis protein PilO [Gammaproteobacteria bacterium]